MNTSIRYFLTLLVGVLIGSAAAYVCLSSPNYAEIIIVNDTSSSISLVEVTEDRFGNRYVAEHLAPSASVVFPVFARGELGYRINVVTDSGSQLSAGFYAEVGYKVTHSISGEGIGYEVSSY